MYDSFPLPAATSTKAPKKIVLVEMAFDVREGKLEFFCTERSGPKAGKDIESFLSDQLKDDRPPRRRRKSGWGPLDFRVTEPCYVVLRLAEGGNWRFSQGSPAITTKGRQTDRYTNLTHVARKGHGVQTWAGQAPEGVDCRMAYFVVDHVAPKTEKRKDGFNIFIDFLEVGHQVLSVVIDPEIHNEGPHN